MTHFLNPNSAKSQEVLQQKIPALVAHNVCEQMQILRNERGVYYPHFPMKVETSICEVLMGKKMYVIFKDNDNETYKILSELTQYGDELAQKILKAEVSTYDETEIEIIVKEFCDDIFTKYYQKICPKSSLKNCNPLMKHLMEYYELQTIFDLIMDRIYEKRVLRRNEDGSIDRVEFVDL